MTVSPTARSAASGGGGGGAGGGGGGGFLQADAQLPWPQAEWISTLILEWLRKQCYHPTQELTWLE